MSLDLTATVIIVISFSFKQKENAIKNKSHQLKERVEQNECRKEGQNT